MTAAAQQAFVIKCESEPLVAVLHPAAQPTAERGVVIVVGGPQYRVGSHRQFVLSARAFALAGFPVLRIDLRGMGDSASPPRSFEDAAADIRCAVDAICALSPGLKHVALYGLCDGASAAMLYGPTDPRITHLLLANPWVRTDRSAAAIVLRYYYVRRLFQRSFWAKLLGMKLNPVRAVGGLVDKIRSSVDLGAGAQANYVDRMLGSLVAFHGELLCLISGQDLTAQEFVTLVKTNKQWRRAMAQSSVTQMRFPAADHTFSARSELDAMNLSCIRWLNRATAERSE